MSETTLPEDPTLDRPERPLGFLSLVGLFSEWDDEQVDKMVSDIYAARRRTNHRPQADPS